MTKPVLNRNEQLVLNHFRSRPGTIQTTEDVAKVFYDDCGRSRPPNWRSSTLSFIRTLNLKCQVLGEPPIERISRLGVGSQAQFLFRPQD
jgi:hypothetical protein